MAAATDTREQRAASNGAVETFSVELEGRYAGWSAECDADPDWGFLSDLSEALPRGQFAQVGPILLRAVVTWNFRQKDGTVAPVTEEGLRHVSGRAILQLANQYIQRWSQLPNQSGDASSPT